MCTDLLLHFFKTPLLVTLKIIVWASWKNVYNFEVHILCRSQPIFMQLWALLMRENQTFIFKIMSLKMWPYLRKPGIRDKSKMHSKCVEKCIDNALQRISTHWKRFPTCWNYFRMHWQRFAMGWQRLSTRWTTHCKPCCDEQ